MALKKPNYVIEGYSKLHSAWIFICFVQEDAAFDSIDVSDFDEIRVRLNPDYSLSEKEMKCPFCGDEIYLGLSKKKDWFYCENCEKEVTEPDYGLLLRQSLERDRQRAEAQNDLERQEEKRNQLKLWKSIKTEKMAHKTWKEKK